MNTETTQFCKVCSCEVANIKRHEQTNKHLRYSQKGVPPKPVKEYCGLCSHSVNGTLREHEATQTHKAEITRREKAAAHYEAINKAEAEYTARKMAGQDTSFSVLFSKHCPLCDKHVSVKNWGAHEKTQGHITKAEAQLITEIMNYEPKPEPKPNTKYCSLCAKHISAKNWGAHNKTKGHIKNLATMEARADSMNNLAAKVCPSCCVPFLDWREHSKTDEHKLNEAEARLSALSAE